MNLETQNINQEMLQEVLQLRIEYLKRSKLYKELCEFLRINKDVNFPKDLPDKFQGKVGLLATYMMFGNLHSASFSIEGAIFVHQRWTKLFNAAAPSPVIDYSGIISSEIDSLIRRFVATHGREPTLIEFRDYFTEAMEKGGPLYLRIDAGDHDMKTLVLEFKKLVRKHRRTAMFLFPTTYVKVEELETYLRVYDLKEAGLTIKQIVQTVDPENKGNALDTEREFKRYIQKAKRIISNVERGAFPGNYQ